MNGIIKLVMQGFALVVTDRRWAAPLSAMALGFGLFVGVAIGPSAAGSLAGTAQIVEMPSSEGDPEARPQEEADGLPAPATRQGSSGVGGGGGALPALPPPPPGPAPTEQPPVPEPSPAPVPPTSKEPTEDDETELKGVVVHVNPAAGSYALAIKGGELVPVHARKLPLPGTKLKVAVRRLANGTFAETDAPERSGKAVQVGFRGVVTFVDPDPATPAYTVSGRGASILVQVEPDPSGALAPLPVLGHYVDVMAAIENPSAAGGPVPAASLRQRQIEVEASEPATYVDLAGIVTAVLPETSQLLLSADDTRESGTDITLAVPPRIDTGQLEPGDSFLATATVAEEGTLTLVGLASDEHTKGADDATLALGDLKR